VKLVGISGISGSGKTYLLNRVISEIKSQEISYLSFDNYYKATHLQAKDNQGFINFDLPGGVDYQKLLRDLASLKSGQTIELPVYTFNQPDVPSQIITIKPAPILLIEGIFVFHFKELFHQLDLKLFIETDLETTFKRRLERDFSERGIDKNIIHYQWFNHVLPGYQKFLLPFKQHADLIIKNEGLELEKQLPKLKELILSLTSK
jgi:uridine kinase